MKNNILGVLIFSLITLLNFSFAQNTSVQYIEKLNINGYESVRSVTSPGFEVSNSNFKSPPVIFNNPLNNSTVRWQFTDPIAIADRNMTSGNGQYNVVGYGLNTKRVSLYNNLSNTPLWEHYTNTNTYINYVSISDTAGTISTGAYHNIYMYNRTSSTPFFNFNTETLPDTGTAQPTAVTRSGRFLIACANRTDSSWIFGFSRDSSNWTWRYRVGQTTAGGASIQGIKISGNDSLVLVNTYGGWYVFKTYTGQLIAQGSINPSSSSGTQMQQAISGNGSLIAIFNYSGNIRVLQWNGSAYNTLWTYQASGSTWMACADISYDGQYLACGTLDFLGGSNYNGRLFYFKISQGSTPVWTYSGFGDEVPSVAFSKNNNILVACSWGDINNLNNDLLVFRTSTQTPLPIYSVNSGGSFFWCSVSDDGSTIMASGKRVHARTFGNGAEVYNIFIDTNDTPVGIVNEKLPVSFELKQNYPNPFNPTTQINFSLPENSFVKLSVFDILGKEIKTLVNNIEHKGTHSIKFDATEFPSGVYFYKIVTDKFVETKKMLIVK